jgi:Ca-activated chloride channel family protein
MKHGAAFIIFLFLSTLVPAQESSDATPLAAAKPPVQIFATIVTKDGSTALPAPEIFNVSLDKQQAQVVSLRPAKDEKLLFAVIVDISSSGKAQAQSIKDAAIRIFQGLSSDRSQGYLVLLDHLVMPSKRPLQPSEVQTVVNNIGFGGGTALFDGIEQTCTQTLGRSQNPNTPRRVLILLSDGDDNYSHITLAKADEAAEREGVAVFSLATSLSSSQGEAILKQASKDTGGRAVLVKQLLEGIAPLLAGIQGQSILSIVPSQAADQKLHSLMVRTTEKDLSVSVPARILLP